MFVAVLLLTTVVALIDYSNLLPSLPNFKKMPPKQRNVPHCIGNASMLRLVL